MRLHREKHRKGYAGLCFLAILLLVPMGRAALADEAVSLNIPVYKIVSGIPANTTTFSFCLTGLNDAPMPAGSVNGVKTVTITGPGSTYFGEITYEKVGNYYYTISELVGASGDYSYDTSVYDLIVQVTWKYAAGGELQAIMYLSERGETEKQERAQFTNTVLADYVIIDPPVEKQITGATPSTASVFTFYMKADNAANPMPEGTVNGIKTVTISGSGTAEFGNITYTQAGTYTYTVYERNAGASGYSYDTNVYKMSVVVTETNGKLSATRTITDADGITQSGLVFKNRYTVSDGPKTGDDSLNAVWWAIFTIGAIGVFAAAIIGTKKSNRRK
jgi:pilin isopeptide linkage protein